MLEGGNGFFVVLIYQRSLEESELVTGHLVNVAHSGAKSIVKTLRK